VDKNVIAPFATIFPANDVLAPISTAPLTCQKTLHDEAPLIIGILGKIKIVLKIFH